jgi:2-C-methyl-D-erythritol 4-phosphate cytidylyltransferase
MSKFCVIVPAAGKSERFGGEEKKTFAKLDGRPIFLRTLELFMNREDVCQTILAVAPEDMETMKSQYGVNLGFMDIQLVRGGARRCDTVAAALAAVSPKAEFVAVHDAARPCVTADRIDAVFAAAAKAGAAILACPLTGTLKRVNEHMQISETVPRTAVFEAQTPQVFRKDLLLDAYRQLDGLTEEVTDDAQLIERAGHPVVVVRSDSTNLKITTKADLTLATAILKARPARPVSKLGAFEEAQW